MIMGHNFDLKFLRSNGVKHYRSAVYHPATNGLVERFVKTLKQALKAGKLAGTSLRDALNGFLFQYRSTPHIVTGSPPSELFLGRALRCSLDLLKRDLVEEHQRQQKPCHDRSKRNVVFELGQNVLVRVFRKGLIKWEQGHVAKILGAWMLLVKLQDGTSVKRHFDQVQHFFGGGGRGETEPEPEDQDVCDSGTSGTDPDPHGADPSLLETQDVDVPVVDSPPREPTEATLEGEALDQAVTGVDDVDSSPAVLEQERETTRRYPSRDHRPPERPFFVSH